MAKPKKSNPVTLVLVGIGGMGACYLDELLSKKKGFLLQGVVDSQPLSSFRRNKLEALGIPLHSSLEEFYDKSSAELAIISSPIADHCPQACLALARGSHVLCEKPVAAVIQDARVMSRATLDAKRFAAVGYQWSFSPAIQAIKADILAGVYGKPQRLRCLYLWPRDETYYRRNDWAGRIRDERGRWILDSPANNAMAHDLHNMLYILGESIDRSVQPVSVMAELYRAYPIQNYDTVAGRVITQGGTEILVYFSHASAADIGPVLSYEFEKGTVMASGRRASLKGVFKDGRVKDYGPADEQPFKKLWDSVAAVRSGQPLPCGVEAASSQTLCINGFQESAASIVDFPARLQEREGEPGSRFIFTRGLEEAFVQCYESGLLPSEMRIPWSRPAVEVSLDDYQSYPAKKA